MAKRMLYKVLSLGFILLNSCDKSFITPGESNNSLITVYGGRNNVTTRTYVNGLVSCWSATSDKVGIYSQQARTTSGGDVAVENGQFTALENGEFSQFNGTMYWGTPGTTHNFYAYYPYASGTPSVNSIPVSLSDIQTQSEDGNSEHIGENDFLVSTPYTELSPMFTSSSLSISLEFNHVFALLELWITGTSGELSRVWISGLGTLAFSSGTIDITQSTPSEDLPYTIGNISGPKGDIVLEIETPAALSEDPVKVFVVANVGTPLNEMYIGLEIDGNWKYIKKSAAPAGGFKRGNKYIVNVDSDLATDAPEYPESSTSAVLIAGRWWAPQNCGYTPSVTDGLYYQWHRKYGQTYSTTNYENGPVTLATGNNVLNSGVIYLAPDPPNDWCSESQSSWSMTTSYNPCPSGWRVPTDTELQGLVNSGSTWQSTSGNEGRWYGGNHSGDHERSVFIRAAGRRDYATGAAGGIDVHGRYWSSSTTSTNGVSFRFDASSSGVYQNAKSWGFTLRCVKE